MLWSTVLGFAEVKASLAAGDDYAEALGQLSDRAQRLFTMQPDRPFVLLAALGADSMELLCVAKDASSSRSWRSGKLSLNAHGVAGDLLLYLFSSGPHAFGYKQPFVPEPFSIVVDGQAHSLSSFECLRAPASSTAYSALATTFQSQLSEGQPIVVKLGDADSISHEVGDNEVQGGAPCANEVRDAAPCAAEPTIRLLDANCVDAC